MARAGFVWDPTWNGHARYTHSVHANLTCVRARYMDDAQWVRHMNRYINIARFRDACVQEVRRVRTR